MSLLDTEHIRTRLLSLSPVPAGGRIHPDVLPQNVAYPAISYFRVSTDHQNAADGYTQMENAVFQVDVWDTDYTAAWALAARVRDAMVDVETNFWARCTNALLVTESEANRDLFHVVLEFSIWHRED